MRFLFRLDLSLHVDADFFLEFWFLQPNTSLLRFDRRTSESSAAALLRASSYREQLSRHPTATRSWSFPPKPLEFQDDKRPMDLAS